MVQDRVKRGYLIISMPGFVWNPNIIPTRRTNQTGHRRYWNPAIPIQVPVSIDLALRSNEYCLRIGLYPLGQKDLLQFQWRDIRSLLVDTHISTRNLIDQKELICCLVVTKF